MLYGDVICQQEVAMEGETGKMYRASFRDRQGRSVLILRPGMQVYHGLDMEIFSQLVSG